MTTTTAHDISPADILYDLGKSFTLSNDIGGLLNEVLHTAAKYMPVERGLISIHRLGTDDIVSDASYGYSDEESRRGQYRPGEGIIGTVIASGRPVIISSIKDEPRFLNKTQARKGISLENLSFICVPIKSGDTAIGTISIDLRNDGSAPLEKYAEIFTMISVMIAYAVNQKREARDKERELQNENLLLRKKLSLVTGERKLIGSSAVMKDLYDKILMVSDTDSTVLITGESGTGKELIADEIHYSSARKEGPFVKMNIAALPHNLIESELFGYEKGAFTGAFKQKKGRFELAQGGTIFLDEIGDLDMNLQVHLLRVIQERQIERIGGTHTIPVDVRIIAATHQDLETRATRGEFRLDLFYRLNVFPVYAPPLRERPADIMLLADHFLGLYSRKFGKNIHRISTDAIDLLTAYHWPGNVRELENCLERAVVMSREDVIRNYHLPPSLQIARESTAPPSSFREMTDLFLKETIIDQLKITRGNITRAAQNLGTTKRILNYRIKRMGIDFGKFK